jgi:hypothetical protein
MLTRFYHLPPSPLKGLCAAFALLMPLCLALCFIGRFFIWLFFY